MERQEGRFLFLEEFDYDAIPGRKAFQLFDIDSMTLYEFMRRGDCRKVEFLNDRISLRIREPGFLESCELIAGRMGEAAPILFGRDALMVSRYLLRRSEDIEKKSSSFLGIRKVNKGNKVGGKNYITLP